MKISLTINLKEDSYEIFNFLDKLNITGTVFCKSDWESDAKFGRLDYFFKFQTNWQKGWYSCLSDKPIEEIKNVYCRCHHIRECEITRTNKITPKIMKLFDELGFVIDSSLKGNNHYNPFVEDPNCSGTPCLDIKEIPVTKIGNNIINSDNWRDLIELSMIYLNHIVIESDGNFKKDNLVWLTENYKTEFVKLSDLCA